MSWLKSFAESSYTIGLWSVIILLVPTQPGNSTLYSPIQVAQVKDSWMIYVVKTFYLGLIHIKSMIQTLVAEDSGERKNYV